MTPAPAIDTATLRPATRDDRRFLCRVYASTRETELARVPWTDDEKRTFLEMQFDAQDRYYRQHYASASFDIILVGGESAGRLYVFRGADEIRIVDIALLPGFRSRGLGSALIASLQAEAHASGRPLRIHVERFNPALRLYQRLGFTPIADLGVYLFLEWTGASRPVDGVTS